jgi:hypothetical protein
LVDLVDWSLRVKASGWIALDGQERPMTIGMKCDSSGRTLAIRRVREAIEYCLQMADG